jgi:hypothetical protein
MALAAPDILLPRTTSPRPSGRRPSRLQAALLHTGAWLTVLIVAVVAVPVGIELRHWAWDHTQPIRFHWDIENAYEWGNIAARDGVVATYNKLEDEHSTEIDPNYGLDYSPLRLVVVSHWVKWTQQRFPGVTSWRSDYEFSAPLLRLNIVAELASCAGIFLLVQHWVRRSRQRPAPMAALLGLAGALIFWFNPAVIFDDHCWPQWDVWIVPFYVFAVLLASTNWWFCAGLLIGVGAMIKGQILLASGALVLWPLFSMRWGATARFICGSALGLALVGAPWLASTGPARWWLAGVFLATVLLLVSTLAGKMRSWAKLLFWLPAAGLLGWPLMHHHRLVVVIGVLSIVLLILIFQRLSQRGIGQALLFPVSIAAFLCAPLFGSKLGWLEVGLGYGARKYQVMGQVGTSNLATLLNRFYGWQLHDTFQIPLPFPGIEPLVLNTQQLLLSVYIVTLVLCGIGAAIHARRNDARLLVAITAPWVLFFALLAQMNNRYLVWGAALSAALMTGVSFGMTLLGLLLSLCCLSMMADIMYRFHAGVDPAMEHFLHPLHPAIGWMVLLSAAIILYMSLAPGRRQISPEMDAPRVKE